MLSETARSLKTAAPLWSHCLSGKELRRWSAHGAVSRQQAHRHFGVSHRLTAKVPPPRKPRERVEIPGLEPITYGERMHFVPGLAKPVYPQWERDYKDPRFYKSPPVHEMPLYKEKPCYIFNPLTSVLEGKMSSSKPLRRLGILFQLLQ